MNWQHVKNDLKKGLTPAGILQFVKSHKYSLAISGAFSLLGLFLFLRVDILDSRDPVTKLVRAYAIDAFASQSDWTEGASTASH